MSALQRKGQDTVFRRVKIYCVSRRYGWFRSNHAKLSIATLKEYIEDEGLRNKRMQKFIVDKLTGNKNTINMSNSEVGYIKSFSQRKQLAQDGDIASKITYIRAERRK